MCAMTLRFAALLCAAMLLMTAPARAQQAPDAAVVEGAAEEAVASQAITPEQAQAFREQLRQRLREQMGEQALCADTEAAACQARLRQQVRSCLGEARQQGRTGSEEAAAVAAATMMLSAGDGGDGAQAGELLRRQLHQRWQGDDMVAAAGALLRMQKRWRRQAGQVLSECTGEVGCSGTQARIALSVMEQASRRADLDARQSRRTVLTTLREERRDGTGESSDKARGEALQAKLRHRLRLQARDEAGTLAGNGKQKKHQYRRGMDSEVRRGGDFGGQESGGAGAGFAAPGSPVGGPGSGSGRGR